MNPALPLNPSPCPAEVEAGLACASGPGKPRLPASAESGQSLVEMALGMVFLVILLMGILDLGRAFFSLLALQNAAGEGAAYGAINPHCRTTADTDGTHDCADPNNITYRVQNESPSGVINWSSAAVTIDRPAGTGAGDPITITVTYNFQVLTPVISQILGGSGTLPLTTRVTQNMLADP